MPHHAHAHHRHPRDSHPLENAQHEVKRAETVVNVVYVTAPATFDGPIGGYKTMDGSTKDQTTTKPTPVAVAPAPAKSSSTPLKAGPAVLAQNSPSTSPEAQPASTSPAEAKTSQQPVAQPSTTPAKLTQAQISPSIPSANASSAAVSSAAVFSAPSSPSHDAKKTENSTRKTLSETLVPTSDSTKTASSSLQTSSVGSPANAQASASSSSAVSKSSSSGGMSGGAKAGLAIGILLAVGALAGLIVFCIRRRRNQGNEAYNRANDEKAGFGNEGAAAGLNRSASMQSTKTSATAPRLSLRPVTQFLPDLAAQRRSGNHMAASNGQARHLAPNGTQADAEKGPNSNPTDPANPFGNHAEMSEKVPIQGNSEDPANPFGNHAETDRQLAQIGAESEVVPPAPLRIRTPTPDERKTATAGAGIAAAGVAAGMAGNKENVPKPLKLSPNRAASPSSNGGPSPTASDFSATPVSPGTFANGPPPSNVHRIQLDFKPSMDDELDLRAGQLVRLLHEYDDGWALCIRLDRSQQGVAPRTCLSARPVKPRPPPGARGPPPRGPPPGIFPNQQRPASPANGRSSPSPSSQAVRPSSPSPASGQRSMSPGPYGGGPQRATIPPPGGKRRSNSASAVRERRNSPPGPSPMNPNVQRTAPEQAVAPRSPLQQNMARKPVPGQAI